MLDRIRYKLHKCCTKEALLEHNSLQIEGCIDSTMKKALTPQWRRHCWTGQCRRRNISFKLVSKFWWQILRKCVYSKNNTLQVGSQAKQESSLSCWLKRERPAFCVVTSFRRHPEWVWKYARYIEYSEVFICTVWIVTTESEVWFEKRQPHFPKEQLLCSFDWNKTAIF